MKQRTGIQTILYQEIKKDRKRHMTEDGLVCIYVCVALINTSIIVIQGLVGMSLTYCAGCRVLIG